MIIIRTSHSLLILNLCHHIVQVKKLRVSDGDTAS